MASAGTPAKAAPEAIGGRLPPDTPESPQQAREARPLPATPTDAVLVAAALAGERWAHEALFNRHVRMVTGLVFRVFPSRNDLDDIVQDTFIAAFESLGRLKNPQAFAAWVGSTAIRITHKRLRRRRIAMRLGLASRETIAWDEIIAPGCPADVAAELRETYEVLATFPTNERIAITLRRVEGMALDEIAEATGASLATVKRRIAAAEERLAAAMATAAKGSGSGRRSSETKGSGL